MSLSVRNRTFLFVLALVVLAGGVRFARLSTVDITGDEWELYEMIRRGMEPGQYLKHHFEQFSVGRQMPLPRVSTCALVRFLDIEINEFSLRFLYALVGVLVVPALWLFGRYTWDQRYGNVLALLGAINPYAIYYARHAHIYSFLLVFNVFVAAYLARLIRGVILGEAPRPRHVVLACVSSILACYSHMSAWPVVGLLWVVLFAYVFRARTRGGSVASVKLLILAFAVWAAFLMPWAYLFLQGLMTGNYDPVWKVSRNPEYLPELVAKLPMVMTWGGGWRAVITYGLPAAGLVYGFRSRQTRPFVVFMLSFSAVIFAVLSVMLTTGFFAFKYYTVFWIVLLALSGLGVVGVAEWLTRIKAPICSVYGRWFVPGLCGVVVLAMLNPVWCLVMLPSARIPYDRIRAWMEENLPPGAPVLVDGMNIARAEMQPYTPKDMFLTFAVPDLPPEARWKNDWRGKARDFFLRFPDAAYMDQGKIGWEEYGPWNFPYRHFRQQVTFTNEMALRLRRMVLSPNEAYYNPKTNGIITDVFFNQPDDVIENAREAGLDKTFNFGPGWRYAMTQDFRHWRVLQDRASLQVYNLEAEPAQITVMLRCVAVGGAKQVQTPEGAKFEFENGRIVDWQLGPGTLNPGGASIILEDPLWGVSRIPLLVERVEIR